MGDKVQTESPVAKFVIGGGSTLVFEFAMGHGFEFTKIAKQTSPELSYAAILGNITRQKGIAGIWDGFIPWGATQAVAKGAVFSGGHALSKSMLAMTPVSEDIAEVAAGGMGGFVQGIVLSPLLLLKTRVMTDGSFRGVEGFAATTKLSCSVGASVVRKEGAAALMKGSLVFSCKRMADWTTRYLFVLLSERAYTQLRSSPSEEGEEGVPLSATERTVCSLVGGTLSATATIPIDVLVAQFQQASKAGEKVSAVDLLRAQLKQGGVSGLIKFSTRGYVVRVLHVALTTALMKNMTSFIYDWYKEQDPGRGFSIV